jgi:NADPH-dependent 2,4-dienoyl-CoA reductase/sulfur reductase-like enzyme
MKPIVIVGAGVAGIAAVEAIRSIDSSSEIILISDDPFGYYSRPGLAYLLTGEIPERQLYPFGPEFYKQQRVRALYGRVELINCDSHRVELDDGQRIPYERLLIATGTEAVTPKIPGIQLSGVVKLDALLDARNFLKIARRARSAVVIGGGVTSLELVEGCVARGLKTHYLLRGSQYWGNVLDPTESKIVEERLVEEGVKIHYHTEAAEILGKNGRVKAVRTRDGTLIDCQMLAYAIGNRPRMDMARLAGLATDRGILVDEFLRTSTPDIYAAGDVAQVYDPLTGQPVLDSLWEPARNQGWTAGLNLAGDETAYVKAPPFNVTRLAGLTTMIVGTVGRGRDEDMIGIAHGDSETWRRLPDALAAQMDFDVNRIRVVVGEKHILGAVVMGDQTLSYPIQQMVSESSDISSIRGQLFDSIKPISEVILDFWIKRSEEIAFQ